MSTGIRGLINNFSTTLNGTINNSVTSVIVTDATGISTALASADFVPLTIDDGTNVEIVHVTGVSTNTLTVVRAQEGTSANGFADLTTIECRATERGIKQSPQWERVKVTTVGTAQTTVSFTGLTDGDYRVDFINVQSDVTDDVAMVQGTGGTPTYQTTSYYHSGLKLTYSAGDAGNRTNNGTKFVLCPQLTASSDNNMSGFVEIMDVASAGTKKTVTYMTQQGTTATFCMGGGIRDVAEAVTAIKFFMVSGNKFNTGSKFVLSKRTQ